MQSLITHDSLMTLYTVGLPEVCCSTYTPMCQCSLHALNSNHTSLLMRPNAFHSSTCTCCCCMIARENARHYISFVLQLKSARSMERQAAQQAQQSANSLRHTSSILRTPSLSGALRGMRIRGGETGVEGAASAAATPVPEKATKSVPAHDGGCFTCAFDR